MRVLALIGVVGLLVGCGESQSSGGTGGGAGLGGHENTGGKSSNDGESTAGSAQEEAGGPSEGGTEQGGAQSMAGSGMGGTFGGANVGGMPSVSSGGMGMLSGVCEGAFSGPGPQILVGKSLPSNLSVTGDDLELFFNAENVISSHKRASTGVLFPDPLPVAELSGVCAEPLVVGGMDVTLDGLRLYIECSDDANGYVGPLRVATRKDRQSPFVLAQGTLGTVGNSISISEDELTLFAVTAPGMGYTLVYQRASVDEAFGPAEVVMGLGGSFRYPEISPDGLNLFGVAGPDNGRLVVASRGAPSGPFSSPTSTGLPAPAGSYAQFGPTVSESCRLYYLNFAPNVATTIDLIVH